ncbi:MAG: hypothetical protein IT298_10715 [Chloroflexi bacterium]|jgi:Capsular polysaccharide biosynthesis protein|nr:MAG: putative capsular polysaccharide biosynthesis protein [Chloroflexi bacterium OLB13]MBC6955432.1 hypothetical protein [Chloroflexota bacterium]MBW7880501.1 hypothetical protein [Anaerolineae bacterium]MDL1917350.1 hypothetical protein [Anaerolineae bacterium CFX4]OQY85637.1 MAG: hypothetical protein B6D42_03025 [Anaerolineae bacterium UTCFX5]
MLLSDYLRALARRWWLIVLVAVIAAVGAYVLTSRQPAVYRSTQLVLIQPSRADFGLTEAGRLLLNSMVVYLDSSLIAQQIIDDLQLPTNAQTLMDNKTIAPDTLRLVVQIDVDNGDPAAGEAIAEAWGQALVDYRSRQNQTVAREDRVLALLPDRPTTTQVAPQPMLLTAAAAVLGLIVGVALALALESVESVIVRRREDFRADGINLLAVVPK